jgi:hypothetical protein
MGPYPRPSDQWPGAPGGWGQAAPARRPGSSANAVSLVQVAAGVAILVSLLLSWFDISVGYFDVGSSLSFVSIATAEGPWLVWLDLVVIGVALALITAVMNVGRPDVPRPASAVALAGFGLAAVGAGYYLADGMAWDYSVLSPGPGAFLCFLAAVIGGLAAAAHLANPRLGTTRAAPTGYWGGSSAWPAQTWPPQPLAPVHEGSSAQIVVFEAGQPRMRSVQPGERLLVGRDPQAQVRLADPDVQPWHAVIERRAVFWVVRDLQTVSPTLLIDATGSTDPIVGDVTVEAGQLLIGGVLVTLYPGQP